MRPPLSALETLAPESMAAGNKLEANHSREHPLASEEWLASYILGCIADPGAVCRLALVNKTFCAASASDSVWQKLLPPVAILNPLLAHVDYQPPSKIHLYIYLCKPITYDQGLKKFWLDPPTGGECHMISARALSITWGDTPQYWEWKPLPGSISSEVACLSAVCWFEVTGTFKNIFRPGRYIVSFRLQLHSTHGWQGVPVKFRVQNNTFAHTPHDSEMFFEGSAFKIRTCPSSSICGTSPKLVASDSEGLTNPSGGRSSKRGGEIRDKKQGEIGDEIQGQMEKETQFSCSRGRQDKGRAFAWSPWFLKSIKSRLKGYPIAADGIEEANETCDLEESDNLIYASSSKNPHKWVECDAGEFFVEDGNENHPIEVYFSMKEIDRGWWKGGLFLDGAIIRPSYVIDKIDNDKKKTLLV